MIDIVKLFLLFLLKLVAEGHRQIILLWHMWTEQVAYCIFYMRKGKLRKARCGFHGATCWRSETMWLSKNGKANNSSSSSLYTKPPSKDRNLPYVCSEPGLSTQDSATAFPTLSCIQMPGDLLKHRLWLGCGEGLRLCISSELLRPRTSLNSRVVSWTLC